MPSRLITETSSSGDSTASTNDAQRPARTDSNVCTTPATVELCRADYEAGTDLRAGLDRQWRRR